MDAQSGKFRDIAELGKGGMGDVFLTVASGPAGFNKLLVVKRLGHSLASDPDFLQMFLSEARLAARLNHPNIVHTYEVGFDGSRHYIAMEYLEGQPLHRLVRRASQTGGLSFEMQLRVVADVLAGLHYAHELTDYDGTPLAVVHRDVSPANIFVLYDGQVKLVDFGIAKSTNSTETKVGVFKGKIQYVSPEQFMGGPIDRRADIYSAGVVLWEAATQRRMWKDVGDLLVMQRVGTGDVPTPSSVCPQVPKRLEAICMKALAAAKEDRYPTAAALQADIEEFLLEMDSRVSARDVGALTAKTFEDDRAHLRGLIEDQLRLVRDYPDAQSLAPTVSFQEDTGTRPTALETKFFSALTPAPSRRRNVGIAIGGGVVALFGALALWGSSSPKEHAVAATANSAPLIASAIVALPALPAVSAEPAVSAVVPPVAPFQIMLTVTTNPKSAHVLVDDALLPSSGQLAGFAKDNALHKVRVEAPGYRTKTEWVRFDSDDVNVEISLDRKVRKEIKEVPGASLLVDPFVARALATTAPAAALPPSSPREVDSAGSRRRSATPPLDSADPWKK